jgi:hypothetical protein
MVGNPVFIWASDVGKVVFTKTIRDYEHCLAMDPNDPVNNGGGISYGPDGEVCSHGKVKGDALEKLFQESKHAFFARQYVTTSKKDELYVGRNGSYEFDCEIRGNPEYQAACNEAMAKIGGIPVSLCSTSGQQEPEETDHRGAAAPDDAFMIFCYHRTCVKSSNDYTPCPECKSHPGKQPIMDGWGREVVGYRQGP